MTSSIAGIMAAQVWGGVVLFASLVHLGTTGLLDWGRNNRIEVNIPWLPCEYK